MRKKWELILSILRGESLVYLPREDHYQWLHIQGRTYILVPWTPEIHLVTEDF